MAAAPAKAPTAISIGLRLRTHTWASVEPVEKNNHQQIEEHFRNSLQAVVRNATAPRVMLHRQFRYARSVPVGVNRNKAVHLSVQIYALQGAAAVNF